MAQEQVEVCRAYRNNGRCRYGDDCRFEHSDGQPIPHPAPGVCFDFRDTGDCSRGDSCRFMHGENDSRFATNEDGITQRVSKGRKCSVCNETFDKASGEFSKKQWTIGEGRRCKECIAEAQEQQKAEAKQNREERGEGEGGGGGGRRRNRRNRSSGATCWNCGEAGHLSKDCQQARNDSNEFCECFNCGGFGHISAQCEEPCRRCQDDSHTSANCPMRQPRDQAAY